MLMLWTPSPLDQLRNGLAEVDAAALTPTAQPLGKRCVCGGALTVPEPPTPPDSTGASRLTIDAARAHRRTCTARPPDPSEPARAGPS
jgi:hypothetical protein